ncbi:LOW QUALITY PROTEIN: hypothetical protein YC2023_107219 [Brassica napus]
MVIIEEPNQKEVPNDKLRYRLFNSEREREVLTNSSRKRRQGETEEAATREAKAATLSHSVGPSKRETDPDPLEIKTLDLPPRQCLLLRSDYPHLRHHSRETEDTLSHRFDSPVPAANRRRTREEEQGGYGEIEAREGMKLDTGAIGVATDGDPPSATGTRISGGFVE